MTDSTSRVLVEQRGETRWIRLNNPRQRNAYDREMAGAMSDALESANEVRTVVITGVEDAFCAGGMLEPDALTTTANLVNELGLPASLFCTNENDDRQ